MSYRHPTADVNSAGENPDPITPERASRALALLDRAENRGQSLSDYFPLGSWKRVTEDIIHFTPFDSLPQDEQDAVRLRRRRNFQDSAVPWIVTDYTTLMTAYDDVDDLLKTKTLIKDYALTPAARAAARIAKGRNPFKSERLEGWRDVCAPSVPPRQRKLAIPSFGGLNFLATLGLGALGVLFPQWRLAALALQALQTTDSLFGVGIQLGPILGYGMEALFRAGKAIGGPIFDFDNKYEQLKAARVMQNGNKLLAAAPHAHPDDAFTGLTGFYYSSDADIVPTFVIDQDDYPSVSDVFENPWSFGKEAFDAGRLAASLPYNLGALAVNNLLGDALMGMSQMLGGSGYGGGEPAVSEDNETRDIMRLAEMGICPGPQCEAELVADTYLLSTAGPRTQPGSSEPWTLADMARALGFRVDRPSEQIPQTPAPDPNAQTPVP